MYAAQGQLGVGHVELVGELSPGGAAAISAASEPAVDEIPLDRAAMEFGTD
jgi:argininosuccinate synthase